MSPYDHPAFTELVRSARAADDNLVQIALQPFYELLERALQRWLPNQPHRPRPSAPPHR